MRDTLRLIENIQAKKLSSVENTEAKKEFFGIVMRMYLKFRW